MAKHKAQPKHNPGKFRTHLAQAVKHLELAIAEHNKLVEVNGLGHDQSIFVREIDNALRQGKGCASRAMTDYITDLRPTLPGYIEVSDEGEMEEEG